MELPENAVILLGWVNMKLRDGYASLEELCEDAELDREELEQRLNAAGYFYDKETNRFA